MFRFIALTVHYLSRAVTFGQRRSVYISGSELYRDGFSIPLRFITSLVLNLRMMSWFTDSLCSHSITSTIAVRGLSFFSQDMSY